MTPLTWTRLRSGLWHATRCGKVVATVERTGWPCTDPNPYLLTIERRGIRSKHATALEARQEATIELEG